MILQSTSDPIDVYTFNDNSVSLLQPQIYDENLIYNQLQNEYDPYQIQQIQQIQQFQQFQDQFQYQENDEYNLREMKTNEGICDFFDESFISPDEWKKILLFFIKINIFKLNNVKQIKQKNKI